MHYIVEIQQIFTSNVAILLSVMLFVASFSVKSHIFRFELIELPQLTGAMSVCNITATC